MRATATTSWTSATFAFTVGPDVRPGQTVQMRVTFTGGFPGVELITGWSGWTCTRASQFSPTLNCAQPVAANRTLPALRINTLWFPQGNYSVTSGGTSLSGTFG